MCYLRRRGRQQTLHTIPIHLCHSPNDTKFLLLCGIDPRTSSLRADHFTSVPHRLTAKAMHYIYMMPAHYAMGPCIARTFPFARMEVRGWSLLIQQWGGGLAYEGGSNNIYLLIPPLRGGVKIFLLSSYLLLEGGSKYFDSQNKNDHPPTEALKKTNP